MLLVLGTSYWRWTFPSTSRSRHVRRQPRHARPCAVGTVQIACCNLVRYVDARRGRAGLLRSIRACHPGAQVDIDQQLGSQSLQTAAVLPGCAVGARVLARGQRGAASHAAWVRPHSRGRLFQLATSALCSGISWSVSGVAITERQKRASVPASEQSSSLQRESACSVRWAATQVRRVLDCSRVLLIRSHCSSQDAGNSATVATK